MHKPSPAEREIELAMQLVRSAVAAIAKFLAPRIANRDCLTVSVERYNVDLVATVIGPS